MERRLDAKSAKPRKQATFVLIVMLAFVPHPASDFTINHRFNPRLCKMSLKAWKLILLCIK